MNLNYYGKYTRFFYFYIKAIYTRSVVEDFVIIKTQTDQYPYPIFSPGSVSTVTPYIILVLPLHFFHI